MLNERFFPFMQPSVSFSQFETVRNRTVFMEPITTTTTIR